MAKRKASKRASKRVVFLLHHTGTGASAWPRIMAALFGYTMWRIDTIDGLPKAGDNFRSLDEALEDPRFKGWTWYFFDAKANQDLATIGHQVDKAVYVFGHDVNGWGNREINQLPGALVHLNSDSPVGTQHTAAECAIAAMVHRFYEVDA